MKDMALAYLKKINLDGIVDYSLASGIGLFLALSTLQVFSTLSTNTEIQDFSLTLVESKDAISSADLNFIFKKSEKPKEKARPTFDQAGIAVKGIFYMPPKSSVILTLKKKTDMINYEGDTVYGEIKIAEIQPSKVIFDDNGIKYELSLEDTSIDLFVGLEYDGGSNVLIDGSRSGGSTGSSNAKTENEFTVSSNEGAAKILDEIEKNPTSIFRYMTFKQEFDNGELKGIRVTLRSQAEVFENAGLKTGDLVTSINGFGPSEYSSPKFLSSLKGASKIDFQIDREGITSNIVLSR